MKHTRFWGAATVCLALVATACGGDDDDTADAPVDSATGTEAEAPVTEAPTTEAGGETTTPAETTPAEGSTAGTSAPEGGEYEPTGDVVIDGLQRFPALQAQAKEGVAASGDPIEVGIVTMDSGNYVYRQFFDTADNAVAFLNEIGGINGRPIELVKCGTNGSPESTQTCATEMVNSDVVAVSVGGDFNLGALIDALKGVGGSTFGGYALFEPERVAENANFYYSNWAFQTKIADFLKDELGVSSAAILTSNSQTGLSLAELRAQKPLTNVGIDSEIFGEATTAGSFDALASNATGFDAVVANGGNLMCSGIPISLRNVGFTGPVVIADGCNDQPTLDAGVGMYFAMEFYTPLGDPAQLPPAAAAEMELYISESQARAPQMPLGGFEQIGFSQFINFAETLAASGLDEFDMETVTDLLSSSAGANFTAGNYDCGATPYEPFPAFCSFEGAVYEWDGTTMNLATDDVSPPSETASRP